MQQTFLEHMKYLYSVFSHDNIFISGLMLEIWFLCHIPYQACLDSGLNQLSSIKPNNYKKLSLERIIRGPVRMVTVQGS